jgi:hypothetical protein
MPVTTRQQKQKCIQYTKCETPKPLYEVNIDFDEAHEAWMKNKMRLSNCTYKYICGKQTKKGHRCLKSLECSIHK